MAVDRRRKARAVRRRKRRMGRMVHDLTGEQWAALQTAWGGCAYCGATDQALQRDCVLPISRGGRYTLENVVPACRSCNTSKCNDEVTGWLRRKRLDERTFLMRHLELRTELAPRFPVDPEPDPEAMALPGTPEAGPAAARTTRASGSGRPREARRTGRGPLEST